MGERGNVIGQNLSERKGKSEDGTARCDGRFTKLSGPKDALKAGVTARLFPFSSVKRSSNPEDKCPDRRPAFASDSVEAFWPFWRGPGEIFQAPPRSGWRNGQGVIDRTDDPFAVNGASIDPTSLFPRFVLSVSSFQIKLQSLN